jgi:FolB domain-containing protein
MDTIRIEDLEVRFRVGVPEPERAQPQRLLISIEMDLDVRAAADADDLGKTVDYFQVHQAVTRLGEGREWKLIESLAEELAGLVLRRPFVRVARVQVKKFILPNTRYVAVRIERRREGGTGDPPVPMAAGSS